MSYEDNNQDRQPYQQDQQQQRWQQQPEAVPASQRSYPSSDRQAEQRQEPAPQQQQASRPQYQPQPQQQQQQGGGYQQRQPYNGGQQQGGGYQKPPYNGGQGGYQKAAYGGGGGGGGFKQGGGFKPREVDPNPSLYKPYAAGGNDNPPSHVVDMINKFAKELEAMGYTMRCGGMKGCEDAFENAVQQHKFKEIHLPFKDFDQKQSKFTFTYPEAKTLASRYQPGFDGLKPVVQTFLAKNIRVLQGDKLKSPALFLITWSEDGAQSVRERTARTGNAGHSIAIAADMQIPIFNLGSQDGPHKLQAFIDAMKPQENFQPQQQQHSGY